VIAGNVAFRPAARQVWTRDSGPDRAYLRLTFEPTHCSEPVLRPVVKYRPLAGVANDQDYSTTVEVQFDADAPAPVDVYFLVFRDQEQTFTGIELPPEQAGCLTDATSITDFSHIPLLLNMRIPRTHGFPTHQTFTWEHAKPLFPLDVQAPLGAQPPTETELRSGRPLEWAPVTTGVKVDGRRWTYAQTPPTPSGYLTVSKATISLGAQQRLTVTGKLKTGALTIGLQRDNKWVMTVDIAGPRPFLATLQAPEASDYTLVIAAAPSASDSVTAAVDQAVVIPLHQGPKRPPKRPYRSGP
jgi:hypothetical protein